MSSIRISFPWPPAALTQLPLRKPLRPVRIQGDVAYVQLTQGYEAIIDAVDVPLVRGRNWYALRNRNAVYAATTVRQADGREKTIYMHTVLSGFGQTDHKDRDGLNNRRANLRDATDSQNAMNRRRQANNSTGFKGVSLHKRIGLYQARISANRTRIHLGYFETPQMAHAAYLAAAKKIHGEFGRSS